MIAPEPIITAYLKTIREAVLASRYLARVALNPDCDEDKKKTALEQINDLQHAIHVPIELLNEWERCDEGSLRSYFSDHDKNWKDRHQVLEIMLMKTFNEAFKNQPRKTKKWWFF